MVLLGMALLCTVLASLITQTVYGETESIDCALLCKDARDTFLDLGSCHRYSTVDKILRLGD